MTSGVSSSMRWPATGARSMVLVPGKVAASASASRNKVAAAFSAWALAQASSVAVANVVAMKDLKEEIRCECLCIGFFSVPDGVLAHSSSTASLLTSSRLVGVTTSIGARSGA